MIAWKPSVTLFVRWYVGGVSFVRIVCITDDTCAPDSAFRRVS